jgi:hypothetical protein
MIKGFSMERELFEVLTLIQTFSSMLIYIMRLLGGKTASEILEQILEEWKEVKEMPLKAQ